MEQPSQETRESEAIEAFHLSFMRVMQTRMSHARYILKGGGNLRYYYGSNRYSRDLDFDTEDDEQWKLEASVDGCLNSAALRLVLEAQDLVVKEVRKPKQTETTQRWKVLLAGQAAGSSEVWTKVEFSRRELDDRWITESFRRRSAFKGFTAPVAGHYLPAAAIDQKVAALAFRTATKPRDIFDLGLLLTSFADDADTTELDAATIATAIDNTMAVTEADYQAQVIPYLEPDAVDLYASSESWHALQNTVVEGLMAMHANVLSLAAQAKTGREL